MQYATKRANTALMARRSVADSASQYGKAEQRRQTGRIGRFATFASYANSRDDLGTCAIRKSI